MATLKQATVQANTPLAPGSRLLRLRMVTPTELGFHGGQYIIVHTHLVRNDGSRVKRTYSIVSDDRAQQHFELAIQAISTGSRFMTELEPGAILNFSGPWGRKPPLDGQGPVYFIATDSGITTTLGLLAPLACASPLSALHILWLRPAKAPFATVDWVRHRLPKALSNALKVVDCDPPAPASVPAEATVTNAKGLGPAFAFDHSAQERAQQAVRLAQQWLATCPLLQPAKTRVILSGDGLVICALHKHFLDQGVSPQNIIQENFFNKPPKAR